MFIQLMVVGLIIPYVVQGWHACSKHLACCEGPHSVSSICQMRGCTKIHVRNASDIYHQTGGELSLNCARLPGHGIAVVRKNAGGVPEEQGLWQAFWKEVNAVVGFFLD
mgnify:CR=1